MVIRTFLKKCNTILKNSYENYGLNPVVMLNYGLTVSRGMIYFELDKISKNVENGNFADISKVRHTLKMTNCGSIDDKNFYKRIHSWDSNMTKRRATSFDIVLVRIPEVWDEGVGFDNGNDLWYVGDGCVSTDGSNWFESVNGKKWKNEGIVTSSRMENELIKFKKGIKDSYVVGYQHFDHGNEDLCIDITDYVNALLNKEYPNNGLCLMFNAVLEESESKETSYVGFFSNNTNTFFEPVVESRYDVAVEDNRHEFYIGKTNHLNLYARIGGNYVNLDEMPICKVDDIEYPVKKVGNGIYSAEVRLPQYCGKDEIHYDVWSNLYYEGEAIDEIEQEFVTQSSKAFFEMSYVEPNDAQYTCSLVGIPDHAQVQRCDKLPIKLLFRKRYNTSEYVLLSDAKYRLYVKENGKEYDVIDWDTVNKFERYNVFTIDTMDLVPNEYFVDVKVSMNGYDKTFKEVSVFTIVNNSTKVKK